MDKTYFEFMGLIMTYDDTVFFTEKRRSSSNNETPLHEPVIVEPTSNSNCSSKSEPISKESEPERLNTRKDLNFYIK